MLSLAVLVNVLASTLRLATPLVLTAMGGIFSERSGIVNIALEGIMLIGAFAAATTAYFTGSAWLGVLAAVLGGMAIASIHAVVSIKFQADQVVSGVAINILALGVTGFLMQSLYGHPGQTPPVPAVAPWRIPILADQPAIGPLFRGTPFIFIALLLVPVVHYVLFYTPFGLRLRSVGEHPLAAETMGINVARMRYIGVLLSGAFAGLGGASLSVGLLSYFVEGMTAGRGFIALAAMIFGKWSPFGALLAGLIFGFADALQFLAQTLGLVQVPREFLFMAPYVLTLLALVGVIGRSTPPASVGVPYRKGER